MLSSGLPGWGPPSLLTRETAAWNELVLHGMASLEGRRTQRVVWAARNKHSILSSSFHLCWLAPLGVCLNSTSYSQESGSAPEHSRFSVTNPCSRIYPHPSHIYLPCPSGLYTSLFLCLEHSLTLSFSWLTSFHPLRLLNCYFLWRALLDRVSIP
jgi:hypothetical protein